MRLDWWRFWLCARPAPPLTSRSWSLTLVAGGRERTVGYRRKGWIE